MVNHSRYSTAFAIRVYERKKYIKFNAYNWFNVSTSNQILSSYQQVEFNYINIIRIALWEIASIFV